MSKKYFMVIDAGTGGSRCLIFDENGKLVIKEYDEWQFTDRNDISMMAKEFNPNEFWNKILISIKKALINSKIDPQKIIGISSTSFRQGIILLDKNGKELYAGPADDLRALSQAMTLYQKYKDDLYKITGRIPPILFASAKLTWFKEKNPELYNKINMLLMMNDWIIYKLSGKYCSEPSAACETELFDIKNRKWSKELINLLELPEDIYPPIYNSGTIIGNIKKDISEITGLKEDTPVIVGGADSECSLIGMGLIKNGDIGIIAGTTTPIMMVLDKPLLISKSLWTNCHILKNKWVIEANAGPSGKIFRWLRDTLAIYEKEKALETNENAYELMDQLISQIPLGSNNCYAFLGPMKCDWENLAPLGMGGFLIPLPIDVQNNHLKGQILRAYFENMAYVIKINCDQIERITNIKISEVSISGGLANSIEFIDIVANTLNLPVKIYNEVESTGLGTAISISVGTKIYSNFEKAINSMVKVKKIINPEKSKSKIYKKMVKKWIKYQNILSKLN